jgi:hypothetical protein
MNRAEAFKELSLVTVQVEELQTSLVAAMNREKELYAFLKLPHPTEKEKRPQRKRITKEKAIDIRRTVVGVMRELCGKGLTWLPMQLIVKRANQEMPNAEETEIETQVRFLAQSQSAPIEHNGQRGNGSCYTYTGTKPVPKPTPQQ